MKQGKNRYYKNSRISEAKFRQLLRAFSKDFTATDSAYLTKLSVRRVNDIFIKLRRRIAEYCELKSPCSGEVEVDESYFGPKHIVASEDVVPAAKQLCLGSLKGTDTFTPKLYLMLRNSRF
jgi:transposase